MMPSPDPIKLPKSYESLPLTHVKVSHHPAAAPEATPVVIYPMFDVDNRVKAVVLTGAGKKILCARADLERGFESNERERNADWRDPGGRLALAIYRCSKPTIAAMQGSAVGLGMTMTLHCAIRISCEKAKYGFVFARRGLSMESSSYFFLPRMIGYSNAMYLLTTGGVLPPTSPHFGRLFAATYPDATQVVNRALALATEIKENVSPMASYLSRTLMWRNPGSAEGAHLVDSAVLYHMFSGRDQKEGVAAFFEKRKPNFLASLEQDAPPSFPWWSEVDTGRLPKVNRSKL